MLLFINCSPFEDICNFKKFLNMPLTQTRAEERSACIEKESITYDFNVSL